MRFVASRSRASNAARNNTAISRSPQRIGAWQVLDVLGDGATSTVYRVMPARAARCAVRYALKLQRANLADQKDARDRFKREVQILRAVKHRNVVQLIESGEHNGRLYIVMELVEGRSMRDALLRYNPSLLYRLDWSIQIARAVSALHNANVVHRDLKPENILITRVGVIKLADFGLAHSDETASVTNIGLLVGTPAYIAPEYLLGQDQDHRSDLYSLGVILYELFTGIMPYDAVTLGQYIGAHLESTPIAPRRRVPSIPHSLEKILMQLLEKRPQRRFASAEALRKALEDVRLEVVQHQHLQRQPRVA